VEGKAQFGGHRGAASPKLQRKVPQSTAKYRKVGHSEWYNEYSDTPWHQAERVKTVQLVLGMPKKQIFCKI
jgi:hypothetical protein